MTAGSAATARIGVICALHPEAMTLRRRAGLAVRACGVSGAGAADAARELAALGCRLIVSWGTAGALTTALHAGDLVLPARVIGRGGAVLATDNRARDRLTRRLRYAQRASAGTLLESARLLADPGSKRAAAAKSGAGAVDMESGRVGEACIAQGLPFLAVRAIVDQSGDRLPRRVLETVVAAGELRPGAFATAVLRHPGEWPALALLVYRFQRARAALALAARALESMAQAS